MQDSNKKKEGQGTDLPENDSFKSTQLDLFQSFLCNTDEQHDRLSNTIELWDSIPKYSLSQQAINPF